MHSIAVAMVEPQYHVNVGHVARLMKNFGLFNLYFVNPHFDAEEAIRYAMHGSDVLARARSITLANLKNKFDYVIGTTAIGAASRLNVLRESVSAAELAELIHEGGQKCFCIVLGREASGMNNKELAACDIVCTIDSNTNYKTMNVAHALAIMLYEIAKHKPIDQARRSKKKLELASKREVALLLQYVKKLANAGNFDEHKKPLLEAAVKKIVAKSQPSSKDIMLLVSLLRKGQLAIERKQNKTASRGRKKV